LGLELRETIPECLRRNPGRRMRARDIADWVWINRAAACRAKMSGSKTCKTEKDFRRQLVSDICAVRKFVQSRYGEVQVSATRPFTYSWQEEEKPAANIPFVVESPTESPAVHPIAEPALERALYPLLARYLATALGVDAHIIDARRMTGRRARNHNEALFPDLVGAEDLTVAWHEEVRAYAHSVGARCVRLWSLEVKRAIFRSSVRRDFFQAVANSSWANVGYLVGVEFDDEALEELRVLVKAHQIGVMRLVPNNLQRSEILIPARERTQIDFAMASRLAGSSPDFVDFLAHHLRSRAR